MEENNSIYEVNEMENSEIYEAEPETEMVETKNEISIYEAEPETEMVETKSNAGIGIVIGAVLIGAAAGKVVYDKIKESKDPEIKEKKDELKKLKKEKREERKQQLKEKFKFGKKDEPKKIEAATEVVDVNYEEVKES